MGLQAALAEMPNLCEKGRESLHYSFGRGRAVVLTAVVGVTADSLCVAVRKPKPRCLDLLLLSSIS